MVRIRVAVGCAFGMIAFLGHCTDASLQAASLVNVSREATAILPGDKPRLVEVVRSEAEMEPEAPDDGANPFLEPERPWANELDCDITGDGICNCDDIDELTDVLASGGFDPDLDLDGNGSFDFRDREHLITNLMNSTFGDSNLDGTFSPGDFILVFSHGYYENPAPGRPLSFCEGDWNGDGVFDSSDLVLAFEESVYTPEPSTGMLFLLGLGFLARRKR